MPKPSHYCPACNQSTSPRCGVTGEHCEHARRNCLPTEHAKGVLARNMGKTVSNIGPESAHPCFVCGQEGSPFS